MFQLQDCPVFAVGKDTACVCVVSFGADEHQPVIRHMDHLMQKRPTIGMKDLRIHDHKVGKAVDANSSAGRVSRCLPILTSIEFTVNNTKYVWHTWICFLRGLSQSLGITHYRWRNREWKRKRLCPDDEIYSHIMGR